MASQADDDLTASKTEGYKAGEKKTVEEYAKLGMQPSQNTSYAFDEPIIVSGSLEKMLFGSLDTVLVRV